MKKFIATLMCVALTLGASMTCFASTEVTTLPGAAETKIQRTVGSEYSVLIPKTITITSTETTQTFEIQAKGNLSATKQIDVSYDSATVDMKRAGDDSYDEMDAMIQFNDDATVLSWTEENTTSNTYSAQGGTVTFEETKAGEYSGTATFNIALNEKQ